MGHAQRRRYDETRIAGISQATGSSGSHGLVRMQCSPGRQQAATPEGVVHNVAHAKGCRDNEGPRAAGKHDARKRHQARRHAPDVALQRESRRRRCGVKRSWAECDSARTACSFACRSSTVVHNIRSAGSDKAATLSTTRRSNALLHVNVTAPGPEGHSRPRRGHTMRSCTSLNVNQGHSRRASSMAAPQCTPPRKEAMVAP